jgi:hypothetical protein
MSKSTQINKPFGTTLEFSCTVTDGKITNQEIVSSGPDALVSFKIDKGNYLDAHELQDIAKQILAAQFEGFAQCTPDESTKYLAQARQYFELHKVFSKTPTPVSQVWILAECFANNDAKTMYAEMATVLPKAPTSSDVTSVSDLADNDEDEEDDDWFDGSEKCPCGCEDDDEDEDEDYWPDDDYEDDEDEEDFDDDAECPCQECVEERNNG